MQYCLCADQQLVLVAQDEFPPLNAPISRSSQVYAARCIIINLEPDLAVESLVNTVCMKRPILAKC